MDRRQRDILHHERAVAGVGQRCGGEACRWGEDGAELKLHLPAGSGWHLAWPDPAHLWHLGAPAVQALSWTQDTDTSAVPGDQNRR